MTIQEKARYSRAINLEESRKKFKGVKEWEVGYCQGATEQLEHDLTVMGYILESVNFGEKEKELALSLFIDQDIDENIFK